MPELTESDVKKLKVAELKSELSARDLATNGNKAVLVKRLLEHIENEEPVAEETTEEAPPAEEVSEEPPFKKQCVEAPKVEEVPAAEVSAEPSKDEDEEVSEGKEDPMDDKAEEDNVVDSKEATPVAAAESKGDETKEEEAKAESSEKTDETKMDTEEGDSSKDTKKSEGTTYDTTKTSYNSYPPRQQNNRPPPPEDKGLEVKDGAVVLDFYNSDVFLRIEDEGLTGSNRVESGFSQLWTCAKTTYGANSGKVCFGVTLKEKLECRSYENFGVEKHQFRIGVASSEPNSVPGMNSESLCIDNFGKKYIEGKAEQYFAEEAPKQEAPKQEAPKQDAPKQDAPKQDAPKQDAPKQDTPKQDAPKQDAAKQDAPKQDAPKQKAPKQDAPKLQEKDNITVAVDFDEKTISFYKNGESLGEPIPLPEGLAEQELYPSIAIRNMPYTLVVSEGEGVFQPEGFTYLQDYSEKVRGPLPPAGREEGEVVLMVGFPSSGKTTWVKKYIAENQEKHYNILGTSYILKRMSDAVEARRKTKNGRMGYGMINHAENMLRIVFDLAGRRARNYIIDQHNCQSAAQRRKLNYFNGGYKKKAVVLIPSEDTLKERSEGVPEGSRHEELPSDLQNEMKAYLTIPVVPEQVAEVIYVESTAEEVSERVKAYNQDGQNWLKKYRRRRSGPGSYHQGNRGGYNNYSNYRGNNYKMNNNYNRDSRYSPYGGGRGGGYHNNRGGGGYGGYRGGYGGNQGGGYGGGGYRGGYNNNRGGYNNRGYNNNYRGRW